MNPDGNPNRPQNSQLSSQPAEIIDVSVVEEIAPSIERSKDVWDRDEAEVVTPIEETVQLESPAKQPPISDNWSLLLDDISREVEPDRTQSDSATASGNSPKVERLLRVEAEIKAEIAKLQVTKIQLQQQIDDTQVNFGQIVKTTLGDLERQRQKLQISVEQLERRRDRIEQEIDKSFAGASQNVAIRLQGFKDYLVGSLQDLVTIAEEIEFPQPPPAQIRIQTPLEPATPTAAKSSKDRSPQFVEPAFKATAGKVRSAIDRYRTAPDYYAPAWQLRRTLEAVHADKVADWFFTKDGRGAVRSMNSRLQNILVAAAAVSALRELYGDYLRTLVLANLPERLGDWRRGFQDCLGLSKPDFGGNGGIILFEDPEALIQKADRIVGNKEMPLIIIDNSEGQISLSILEYPLWLAFATDLERSADDFREFR